MLIELMGRDDEAGARLPYLAPGRRVQVDEMDVTTREDAAGYHSHSSSSKMLGGTSSSR